MFLNKRLISLGWASIIFVSDQASKFYLENLYRQGSLRYRAIIPGLLEITPLHNPGIFFGLWQIPYLRAVTLVIAALVFLVTLNLPEHLGVSGKTRLAAAATGLIWGGMLGNTTDRLLMGKVFDFIRLRPIPVFNLADMALTAGAVMLLCLILAAQKKTAA